MFLAWVTDKPPLKIKVQLGKTLAKFEMNGARNIACVHEMLGPNTGQTHFSAGGESCVAAFDLMFQSVLSSKNGQVEEE